MKVYLAGPITGQSYDGAVNWREEFAAFLKSIGHISLSPLRGKFYLQGIKDIDDSYEDIPTSSSRGLFARDTLDVRECDMVLANFLPADRVSIGTCMEIMYAFGQQKYVLTVMEAGSVHDHAFVREASSLVVRNMDEAKVVIGTVGQGHESGESSATTTGQTA